jgi:hypothetical protein
MAEQDPASLAGKSGEVKKENGDSSKSRRMNNVSLPSHQILNL